MKVKSRCAFIQAGAFIRWKILYVNYISDDADDNFIYRMSQVNTHTHVHIHVCTCKHTHEHTHTHTHTHTRQYWVVWFTRLAAVVLTLAQAALKVGESIVYLTSILSVFGDNVWHNRTRAVSSSLISHFRCNLIHGHWVWVHPVSPVQGSYIT